MYKFPFSFVKFKWKLKDVHPPGPDSEGVKATHKCHKNAFHSLIYCFIVSHQLMRVMACNFRLEQKLNTCLWVQKVLTVLVLVLLMLNLLCLYLLGTSAQPS